MVRTSSRAPVAVIVGATSKWQADGRNTRFAHGGEVDDRALAAEVRWGVGGAIALKFAAEGFRVAITTRTPGKARALAKEIEHRGGHCIVVELDLMIVASVAEAFACIRAELGDPEVVVYNAGYMDGRELPPGQELLEYISLETFEIAHAVACRGPFLVAKQVLPAMRARGSGSLFITNNAYCLRGHKRETGESFYYPRVMMRTLAQVLTEEYAQFGIHVANVIIDGYIDSPGTRYLPAIRDNPALAIDPARIADAYYYLHQQHPSCWTHEIQLTPNVVRPSW